LGIILLEARPGPRATQLHPLATQPRPRATRPMQTSSPCGHQRITLLRYGGKTLL